MKRLGMVYVVLTLLVGCKTVNKMDSAVLSTDAAPASSAELMRIWNEHIQEETAGKKLQADCWPKHFAASKDVAFQGTMVVFHGFTACPQQFFSIGEQLAAKGFEVFIPLLPGQGREPLDGFQGEKDNFYDLPGGADQGRYQKFVDKMNQLGRAARGTRIIAGLSGGGALAAGAAVHGKDIWNRAILYAPYLKNPGISGAGSAVLDVFMPNYVNDWGPNCRATRRLPNGRNGLCALKIDAVRAMTDYGLTISPRFNEITIPTQIVGVEADPTADNGAINRAFQQLKNARICFYIKGVPHSIINPRSDAPELDPFWVPALDLDSLAFMSTGEWFKTDGVSVEYGRPLCRTKL